MSKKPILYVALLSQPCRSVLMTCAELEIDYEQRIVDLFKAEHLTPEYLKINPQHTIPLLDDNGVIIADSHAICGYLSDKYGKTDRLYPNDLVKRAIVNSRLHFDSGHLFARQRFLYEPILYFKSKEMPADRIQYLQTAWDILERFLEKSPFVCGNEMTIADICLMATASSMDEIVPLDPSKHSNVIKWMNRISKLSYYEEVNGKRSKALQAAVRDTMKRNAEL